MTIIDRFSTSSYNTFDDCQMQWFLTYVLGYSDPSGKAAAKGTMCHSVMEAIAKSKILRQKGQKTTKDEVFGTLKQTYKTSNLIKRAYDYHSAKEKHLTWVSADYKDVIEWANIAIHHPYCPEYHHEIVSVEERFKFPIKAPWALLPNGKRLNISGIVDLVFRDKDGRLNYLDYKFGKEPRNWNTGETYTYDSMRSNIQLGLYYWAVKQLYEGSNPRSHIWYPRTDNLWSYDFNQDESDSAMYKIKLALDKILHMEEPSRNKSWKCTKMCQYGKKSFAQLGKKGLDIKPNGTESFPCASDGQVVACDAATKFFSRRSLEIVIEACKATKKGKK